MVRKLRKKLNNDLRSLGVVYMSTLSKDKNECMEDLSHVIIKKGSDEEKIKNIWGDKISFHYFINDSEKFKIIENLEDDKFFNNFKKYNIIRC